MTTVQKKNLEEILFDINQYINIDKDRQIYSRHFDSLRDIIFKQLRQNNEFGYLFNGYQLGGSYGDNLKVTLPNEFDLVFHIKFPENQLIDVVEDHDLPGNVHLDLTRVLHKIRNEKQHESRISLMRSWVNDDNYLIVNKLQSYFQSCFTKVLKAMNYQATLCNEYSHLRYRRQGPAHTIYINGENLTYSVDFVPGILLDEKQSVMSTHVGQWEAIPKPIYNGITNYTSFRSSFYREEQKLIENKKNLKNVLRMMKKFRDAHLNMNKMKSYFIKTLFLWKAKEKQGTCYWETSLTTIIKDMFKAMEDSLERKSLPFFWNPRLNMYSDFTPSLLREMLICVQRARITLGEASVGLTPSLQNRTYRIFLESKERTLPDTPSFLKIIPDTPIIQEDKDISGQQQKDKSWCTIA